MRRVAVAGCCLTIAAALTPTARPAHTWASAHHAAIRYRHLADWYSHRTTYWKRRTIALERTLLHRPSSLEALELASVVYAVPFQLLYRRASCESTGSPPASPPSDRTLNAYAKNPTSSASGLMQFMPTTFASTPFAAFSIWSPYASAMAGAWMEAHGRGSEWACR